MRTNYWYKLVLLLLKMADPQTDAVKSPIIMKVDAPVDDDDAKQENEDNEKTEDRVIDVTPPQQICSPVFQKSVLSSSRFMQSNPFASKSSLSQNKTLLRPPQLMSNVNFSATKTVFSLNPSRLNPFAKAATEEEITSCDNPIEMRVEQKNTSNGDTLKFVPLLQTENKVNENLVKPVTSNLSGVQTSPSFVFGQNLHDRVMSDGTEDPKPSTSLTTNGTSEMLFSNVIKDTVKPESDGSKETKSLSESAREYEESRANKRKYEEVEVRTGEEGETNVLQLSCKLFAFDKTGTWQERGRGNLRLNDLEVEDNDHIYSQSRLVFRTSGSLRVVLNTKIWADMTIDRASAKSIRFTAIDSSGDIKVYLIMANAEEIKHIYKNLDERVRNEKEKQKHKKAYLSSSVSSPNELDTGSQ